MVTSHAPKVTPVGFEPTPFRNGALSHRLRPLGQSVSVNKMTSLTYNTPIASSQPQAARVGQVAMSLGLQTFSKCAKKP